MHNYSECREESSHDMMMNEARHNYLMDERKKCCAWCGERNVYPYAVGSGWLCGEHFAMYHKGITYAKWMESQGYVREPKCEICNGKGCASCTDSGL